MIETLKNEWQAKPCFYGAAAASPPAWVKPFARMVAFIHNHYRCSFALHVFLEVHFVEICVYHLDPLFCWRRVV
ncbi:hypothetical protein KIN20_016415 [Parelaphostrongylus tenuis]|uniref:Uncharacterized protein n=1 Tax=Parelaphostrongylus tenuis TaxID=148309 RepID=A0AAD5QQP7_PARTN|nr:hypothetical protein KIN20_016415 [Parelaphostrongylus tenuis]